MEFRVRNSKEQAVRVMCSRKLRDHWRAEERRGKTTLTPPFKELEAEKAVSDIREIVAALDHGADEWLTWLANFGPTYPECLTASIIAAALQPELEAYAELMAGCATRQQLAGWLCDQPLAVRMLDEAIVAMCWGFSDSAYEKRARAFLHVVFDDLCDTVHDMFLCTANELERTVIAYTPRREDEGERNHCHDRELCDCFECENWRRARASHEDRP